MLLTIPAGNNDIFWASFLTPIQRWGVGWPGGQGQRWERGLPTEGKHTHKHGQWGRGAVQGGALSAWLGDSGVEADSLPHVSSGEGVLFSGHVVQGRGHEGQCWGILPASRQSSSQAMGDPCCQPASSVSMGSNFGKAPWFPLSR